MFFQFHDRVWERCATKDGGGWYSRRVEDADKERRADALELLTERDPERRKKLAEQYQKKHVEKAETDNGPFGV